MQIIGLKGLSNEQFAIELQRGARFVIYQYCVSVIILTFKQPSNIYFIRFDESAIIKGLGFSLISFFFGWWGFPWGPIYTIQSLWTNFRGGRNVTREVLASMEQPDD